VAVATESKPVLELRDVSRRFGGLLAVNDISLRVQEGAVVALIGPNGAGKSTLFALTMGELQPSSGRVLFDGLDVHRLGPHARARAGIGRTFQTPRLFTGLSVGENMLIACRAGGAGASLGAGVQAALAEVGLGEQAAATAGSLSQGGRKRLELAMVLALRPRLLLLDEPTAGMGVEERGAIMRLVMDAVTRRGATMVFCEHDVESVFAHAARVVVMDRGAILADGAPERVRRDPRVQQIYLGEAAAHGGEA
jgi:ABC-type branched-subunit amino acid transport system ATPase component